ncbi:MAG: isoprenylcysteine carboxylmethyltransferase family protein [Marivibrio sp.]|uniref:isoprenylcysteine carboxyl methyltransferase family protein n=1 Tax=Marivibrio sp. TaxID=2039719 RepID=UPI0032EB91BB
MEPVQEVIRDAGLAGEAGPMIGAQAIALGVVLAVAFQRLAEQMIAARNTTMLLEHGWREEGARHYPLIVALHVLWLVACAYAALSLQTIHWWLLIAYGALQIGRLWVILSLGPFWTTRILTHPEAPVLRRGIFGLIRHPNYAIVAIEIALLPLAFGAWEIALAFSAVNGALLYHRIRVEDAALAGRPEVR